MFAGNMCVQSSARLAVTLQRILRMNLFWFAATTRELSKTKKLGGTRGKLGGSKSSARVHLGNTDGTKAKIIGGIETGGRAIHQLQVALAVVISEHALIQIKRN